MKKLTIKTADLDNETHCQAILIITDEYARDPMGMGHPLPDDVKSSLIKKLKEFKNSIHFVAFMDDEPAGIANCVFGFSTFYASKVLNVHDLVVRAKYRGNGIGEALLGAIERRAKEEKCCKVTLEVREDNRAKNLYERFGFSEGDPRTLFMEKMLIK
ncbi:GNAT family N-acetyltransferase [Rhodohalobacter sp. SW132]|uniref:GNAT family N-acetyltransferase n=1 Tax=Rhodohalobacter sp. SW132 TaxID=2293433 RepID=UPI000E262D72|nr:GNAT family N-acetyltransferase [Rhodohalobacter sp. SW132]REL39052.1 GNAT family N-acetyltransferase [Rhodohalobacter sp. SW132]